MSDARLVSSKLLSRCMNAFLAKTPILYICTDEIEMIDIIVQSDLLVTRLVKFSDRNKGEYGFRPYGQDDRPEAVVNYRSTLPRPSYGVGLGPVSDDRAGEFPQITVVHMQTAPAESQFEGLVKYVEDYVRGHDDNSALRCSAMILYGSKIVLPDNLIPYTEFIDVDYPDEEEIGMHIQSEMARYQVEPFDDSRDFDDLKASLAGFSCVQIIGLLRRILSADEENGHNQIYDLAKVQDTIRSNKEQMLRRGQILELERVRQGKDDIGGMRRFTQWLGQQKEMILNATKLRQGFGVDCPKGVLLCGVPGCGKSLAAEALSAQLEIPLIKMDVGRLMGRYVGESEHNMLLALRQVEAMSPCILWIDELDKGFSSVGSGSSEDSGIFKRMFGSLLTWMQNNDKPCFIFATANSIAGLPKEFFRSGRFDALFSLFMPTFDECVDILRKRMEKAASRAGASDGRSLFSEACYSGPALEEIVESFCKVDEKGNIVRRRLVTGADIQKIVNTALAFIYRQTGGGTEEIRPDAWKRAVSAVLDDITVYGDGTENLDSIAACYIRLIRNNFSPAAKKVLIEQSEYHSSFDENGRPTVRLDEKSKAELDKWPVYDRVTYLTLCERIEQLAPLVELHERERLVR